MTIVSCAATSEYAENQEPPPSGSPAPISCSQDHLEYIQQAESFFGLKHWSQNTLTINAQGNLSFHVQEKTLDLFHLAQELSATQKGPVLLRFPALIQQNIAAIQNAFRQAIQQTNYQNQYTLAYPLKVNPHASVVKSMMTSPDSANMTFEVGSKAELIIALTQTRHNQRILCNGFKDEEYLLLVLKAAQSGQKICLVFEALHEVNLLMPLLKKSLPINTLTDNLHLGLRLRLNTSADGHWGESNGENSKFGLSNSEVLHVVEALKKNHYLSALKMMHIHPGSQILAVKKLIACFQEAICYYHELLQLGAPIECVDIGGGLGMDYSFMQGEPSRDYTLYDYAMAIIEPMKKYCDQHQLPQPHIISETGRNTVAHSSLLITQVKPLSKNIPDQSQKYLANFSVFQSLPDYWGIQQCFPLLSLHGYENSLNRTGVFHDLTCDSDGVIKHYLHPQKWQPQLALPDIDIQFVGVFLVGAYQEIMASGHNLFEALPCLEVLFNTETQTFDTKIYGACSIQKSLSDLGYTDIALQKNNHEKFASTLLHEQITTSLDSTSYLTDFH